MTLEIRPLDIIDIPLVIDLAWRIWPVAYAGILTPEQIENLLARIYDVENLQKEWAEGHRFWAAYDDEVAVGYASGYREDAVVWLKKLYVLPECQGRGVGRALLQTVIAAFVPAQEIRLLVNSGNHAAQKFYTRCGFSRAREVPVQMGDFQFTDFVYVKPIHAPTS
jgi:ribosomal protein S18 acetylase RimI-like enzyme